MSVLKNKRKASQFEVFHHLYKMRRDITELLLRDFGYSYEKADKRLLKRFNGRGYADLTEAEQLQYDRLKQRWEAFDDWFLYDERQVIVDCLREITKVDVSYVTDEEYAGCMNTVFNSLEYYGIDKSLRTGEKYMYKHLNIGDQVAQVAGIIYPIPIDNYVKIVKGVKFYGRYMDDSYAIHESKEFLEELLKDIIRIAGELGITVNTRKTRICKLSELWRFLQVQYSLTDTGRVIQKINPKRLTCMRRKMKKLVHILTEKEFDDWFNSWMCNHYRIMSKQQRENMNTLFAQLKKEVYHDVHNHPE